MAITPKRWDITLKRLEAAFGPVFKQPRRIEELARTLWQCDLKCRSFIIIIKFSKNVDKYDVFTKQRDKKPEKVLRNYFNSQLVRSCWI